MFGKLIDGKLICADEFFIQGDEIAFPLDAKTLKEYGYKEIVFMDPPIVNNCVGFRCEYTEDEEKIYQKWIALSIKDDSSRDYFVSVKEKINRLELIYTEFVNEQNKNHKCIENIKKKFPWLYSIYNIWKNLSHHEQKFPSNIVEYTSSYNMDSFLLESGYVKIDSVYVKKGYENIYENLTLENCGDKVINLCFLKSNITYLNNLMKFTTFENEVKIHMLYQYMIVIFDDFLMDTVKLVYNYNKKCLCSNKTISYEEVIKAGNYDNLIYIIIDKTLTADGFDNLVSKIEFLEKRGITIDYPSSYSIKDMWIINEIRNCIVHNQGIMSNMSYTRLINNKVDFVNKYKPGDKIDVNCRFKLDLVFLSNEIKIISNKVCDKYKFLFRFFT